MSGESDRTVAARIEQLMHHFGINKAHFASRLPGDWFGTVMEHPDRIVSLTLVCPVPILLPLIASVGSKTLVFSGDRGAFADPVIQITKGINEAKLVILPEYIGAVYDDVIADYTDKVGNAILSFWLKREQVK